MVTLRKARFLPLQRIGSRIHVQIPRIARTEDRFPSLKRRLCGNPKRNALGQIGIAELNRNSLRGQVLIRRMGTASPYEVLGAIPSEIEIWEVEPALDQEVVFRRARENLKVGNWFYLDTGESFEGIPNRPLFDLLERLRSSAR